MAEPADALQYCAEYLQQEDATQWQKDWTRDEQVVDKKRLAESRDQRAEVLRLESRRVAEQMKRRRTENAARLNHRVTRVQSSIDDSSEDEPVRRPHQGTSSSSDSSDGGVAKEGMRKQMAARKRRRMRGV